MAVLHNFNVINPMEQYDTYLPEIQQSKLQTVNALLDASEVGSIDII